MYRLFITVVALVGLCSQAAPPLSPEARALIAPVLEKFERFDREHAANPPANDADRLIQMGEIDQAGRGLSIDLSKLPPDQAKAASDAMWGEMGRRDLENQARLKSMLP